MKIEEMIETIEMGDIDLFFYDFVNTLDSEEEVLEKLDGRGLRLNNDEMCFKRKDLLRALRSCLD